MRIFYFFCQATLANIRELKLGVENIADPNNISDFSEALTKAFETLETVLNIYNKSMVLLYHYFGKHEFGEMKNTILFLVS